VLGWLTVNVQAPAGTEAAFLLLARTLSPVQTGASTVAVASLTVEARADSLRAWPSIMRAALAQNIIHFTTSPPGQALLHAWLADAADGAPAAWSMAVRPYQCNDVNVMRYSGGELLSAAWIAWAMPFLAALAAVPVYACARLLYDADTAAELALLWPLLPSVLLFSPTWNTLYPLLAALTLWGLLAALQSATWRAYLWAALGGVAFSAALFLNFAPLPLLLCYGLLTLGVCVARAGVRGIARAVGLGVAFGVGLASVWLWFFAVSGYAPWQLFAVTMEKHRLLVQRDYWAWLWRHPYDALWMLGVPLAVCALIGMARAAFAIRHRSLSARRLPQGVALAFAGTLVALTLSGTVQGENARILTFYAPFVLLILPLVTATTAVAPSAARPRLWVVVMLLQALCVVGYGAVLRVMPLDMNTPPLGPDPNLPTLPRAWTMLDARYLSDGQFALVGYRFVADPAAQALTIEFDWRAASPSARPYQFELVAYGENAADGAVVSAPFRWYAQNGNYPPTCWREGDAVRDLVTMPLPRVSQPLVWRVQLRLVDVRTGQSAIVHTTMQSADGATEGLWLGPVPYP
jgi:hypothetical protein